MENTTAPILTPNNDEVNRWMLSTLRHSYHVEYFLEKLNLRSKDPERPHDLVGPGNKFDLDVIAGLALQWRIPNVDFKTYLQPAIESHRQQYHHRMWNQPNPAASREDMLVGAIDAVCSRIENRSYQSGNHDYDAIIEIAKQNPPHITPWMIEAVSLMRPLKQPNLEQIDSLKSFMSCGMIYKLEINDEMKMKMKDRVHDVWSQLCFGGLYEFK